VSRRSLLRMVKQLSSSSVLLSTHRMDEAEQLCDNISIMINGKMICYGSPSYLKKAYGKGYTLNIRQTHSQRDFLHVPTILSNSIPNSSLMREGPSKENPDQYEYSFTVTIDSNDESKKLSTMFSKLSEILATGHVFDFTLTRTTLEQIFINFAKFQVGNDVNPMMQMMP
jgi:ABC-type multidrug transport system ATPase subunit